MDADDPDTGTASVPTVGDTSDHPEAAPEDTAVETVEVAHGDVRLQVNLQASLLSYYILL